MVTTRFPRVAALALALLMLVPGPGLALLQGLAPPPPMPFSGAAGALADRAFVGSFDQLDAVPGAGDLAALQPSLESVLRWYALDRGLALSPPLTPDASGADALPLALQALGAATGKVPSLADLDQARALPAELQEALARIVLAWLQAARDYTDATQGLTFADLQAITRGEQPSTLPDQGRMASAALLLDRAVRESAPALRKWGLLLELEERTKRPALADTSADELLQGAANVRTLRDAAALGAAMQGWLAPQARFQPTSSTAGASWLQLYEGLGIPILPEDRIAFQILDAQPLPLQQVGIAMGDGALQGAQLLAAADSLVSEEAIAQASAALARLDLAALQAQDAESFDAARLDGIVEVLRRADQALMLRLQAATLLGDALAMAQGAAAHAAIAPLPQVGGAQTDEHFGAELPPLRFEDLPGLGDCTLGEAVSGELFAHCDGVQNITLPNLKRVFDPNTLSLTIYLDQNGNNNPEENERFLQTPALKDASNDIVLKDPYGFLLVGGNGTSVFDERYGHVNVSLRLGNGTITVQRQALFTGLQAQFVQAAFILLGNLLFRTDLNDTLYEPQYNGVFNLTMNPLNHSLAIVDLGGDDLYTLRPGGANENLQLYNSSLLERWGRTPAPCFSVTVFLVVPIPSDTDCNSENANQVALSGHDLGGSFLNLPPLSQGGVLPVDRVTYLNLSNLSLPVRLGVVLDTSGDDRYDTPWDVSMGASARGLGVLWDAERCHPSLPASSGCAEVRGGHDTYVGNTTTQGAARTRGVGILLDERGNDAHTANNLSLGAGMQRSVGLLLDLEGDDRYFGQNYTMGFGGRELFAKCGSPQTGTCDAGQPTSGLNQIFGGAHTPAERIGLGMLLDRRGDDAYDQANASSSQGKGWPALGLLLDLSGQDRGLQTNLTVTGPLGTYAVGFQENSLTSGSTGTAPNLGRVFVEGRGGGLVLDAEVSDEMARALADAPRSGAGMGATEVKGDTNLIYCPATNIVTPAVFGDPGQAPQKCAERGEEPATYEWKVVSRQRFLLRIPGAFGVGGVLSNDGFEAATNSEEHLLQFDLGGNDLYLGPHAGANLPNMSGLDTEGQKGNPSGSPPTANEPVNLGPLLAGGLLAPVSLLIDASGADLYDGRTGMLGGQRRNLTTPSLGGAWMGIGLLHDLGAAATAGLLPGFRPRLAGCDAPWLNDVYLGFNRTMGFGGLYGIGALVDADGDDCYVVLDQDTRAKPEGAASYSLGAARFGGVGVLLDAKGNDTYLSGNLSQGVGIIENLHSVLPKRINSVQPAANQQITSPPNPLGALFDARGTDTYRFGHGSQGFGEHRANSGLPPSIGPRRGIAGLFVDDGFESDTYQNASWAPLTQPHQDNSFWCTAPNTGPLVANLAAVFPLLQLPRLDDALKGAGAGGDTLGPLRAPLNDTFAQATARLRQPIETPGQGLDAIQAARDFLDPSFDAVEAALLGLGSPVDLRDQRADLNRTFDGAEAQLRAATTPAELDAAKDTALDEARNNWDAINAQLDTVPSPDAGAGSLAVPVVRQLRTLANTTLTTALGLIPLLNGTTAAARQLLADNLTAANAQAQQALSGQGGSSVAGPILSLQREVDRVIAVARDGPNPTATCMRINLGATTAAAQDLGSMGRGFDNLDFFANFLLAASKFGEEYVRARSVLSAPAVVDIACLDLRTRNPIANCTDATGAVRVDARVVWGPESFAYNANQLFRAVCAKVTGNDKTCRELFLNEEQQRLQDVCRTANPSPPRLPTDTDPGKPPFLSCENLVPDRAVYNPAVAVDLNITGNTLKNAGNSVPPLAVLGDPVRRIEYVARPHGTDLDIPLGVFDRRAGLACALDFAPPCPGNVTRPDPDNAKTFSLRWDTLERLPDADGLPTLRTPDGAYGLIIKSYFQVDVLQGNGTEVIDAETQRYVLNRLGDEYGYYPGVGVKKVTIDNPPVVYQLQYDDLSPLGSDESANRELRLNLTVSPRIAPDGSTFGPAYITKARLLPTSEGQATLPDRTFACAGDTQLPERGVPLLPACQHKPLDVANGTGARQRIIAGWPQDEVAALSDGAFVLEVDVTEPAHVSLSNKTIPARTTAACFVKHGNNLVRSDFEEQRGVSNLTTLTSLSDLTQEWLPGQWKGQRLRILDGSAAGEERGIVDNTATTLTLDARFDHLPGNVSAYAILARACKQPLAVDSLRPIIQPRFEPFRIGADGGRYLNRSVAFPLPGMAILQNASASLPFVLDTVNAAQKRSPVVQYEVYATLTELQNQGRDPALVGFQRTVALTQQDAMGNLTVAKCTGVEIVIPDEHPCMMPERIPLGANADDALHAMNRSTTRIVVELHAAGRDLAGNADPASLDDQGRAPAEEAALLDVDGPEAQLCQPVSTFKTDVNAALPRVRTRERTIPMVWVPVADCQGSEGAQDNHGVEAVAIRYNVVEPARFVGIANLSQRWEPSPEEQARGNATFDADARGLQGVLVNNMSLAYAAVARDFAGNVQDRDILVWKTTYDIRPPDLEVLDLEADHKTITYRWFAKDREAPPARVAQAWVEWGTTLNATTGLPILNRTTPAVLSGSFARAILDPVPQDTTHYLRAVSLDDVGNRAELPIKELRTDPVARVEVTSPKAGDVLTGRVDLRLNISDVRTDPRLSYNVSLVLALDNGTLVLPVESFARRECLPGEADCPTAASVIQAVRSFQSARFPDAREAYLRIAYNSSLNKGSPVIVSVGPLKIDNGPPLTELNIVGQGGPQWFRSAVALVLEPMDNITAVAHTEWSFDNFTYLPYNASAPPVQDREGVIPFFFRSVDAAGNAEALRMVPIQVDKQKPLGNLSINGGALGTNDPNVTLTLQASDKLSGVANITLDAGGGQVEMLERPARFATTKSFPLQLPAGEGERRVRIRVVDQAGNVAELKASILVDTSPPRIEHAKVERVAHTTASLAWRTSEPSITRVEFGPAGAEVLANRFEATTRVLAHEAVLQGLRPSLTYQYRIVALDALGNRATLRGTFQTLPDVSPPGAPASLSASDLGNGAVMLKWEAAFDDVGIDHYIVLRGVAGQLDELGRSGETAYLDDRGIAGVDYDYAVQAIDLAGQPGPLSALARARATTKPVLLEGHVTPEQGGAQTIYTYSVLVRDADGDAPSSVRVRISGQARELRPQFEGRADFAQGVRYALETRLPATTLSGGFPTWQFEVADGDGGIVKHPPVPAAGPAVLGQGGIIPGLTAASGIFGLPGFEFLLALAAIGIALLALRRRRQP